MQAFPVVTFSSLSPLTTKGDTLVYSSANVRLAVGANGMHLIADSTATEGVKWAAPTPAFTAFV